MERESFIVYKSFYALIKLLKPADRLKMFESIFEYGFNETEPTFKDATATAIWSAIFPQLKANHRRYENGLKGKDFGVLGGRPKNNPKDNPKNNGLGVNIETPKITPNENDNENDNVNDIESKKESKEKDLNKETNCARESYQEIIDDMVLSPCVERKVWDFITHCQLNKHLLTNSKLESLLVALDLAYQSDDARIMALEQAISGGHFDIKRRGNGYA